MNLRETLVIALRSLRGNRLRSLLTTLGIIIGVAAVIILVALGDGVRANMDAQLSRLANQITITQATGTVPSGGAARPLTDQDVASLQNPHGGAHRRHEQRAGQHGRRHLQLPGHRRPGHRGRQLVHP
jgi:putative ABC transport system permease protein